MITTGLDSRSNWFCLRSQPRRERVAAVNLRDRVGIDVFAPQIRIGASRRLGGGSAEPLFPGYLFARFHYAQQFRHVVSTAGVAGIVSFGARPPAVANEVIDFLRAQVQLADRRRPSPVFSEGAWIRIAHGCFRDVQGRVLCFDEKTERVRVLLSLLGREIQVSVPAHQVVSLAAKTADLPAGLVVSQTPVAPVAG